jgi:hypothetical protein
VSNGDELLRIGANANAGRRMNGEGSPLRLPDVRGAPFLWVSRLLTDRALCGPVPSPLRGSIIIIGVISRANTYRPHWVRQPR